MFWKAKVPSCFGGVTEKSSSARNSGPGGGTANIPLEHTPDPRNHSVYEKNPFISSYFGVPGVFSRGLLEFS